MSGAGAVAVPAAIVGAAEMIKGKYGGLEKGWDERSYMEQATSAPGTMGSLFPATFAGEDTFVSDSVREIARIEQAVMAPIDAIFGIDNSFGTWICTEIDQRFGISEEEKGLLSKLRRYTIKNHRKDARRYLKDAHALTTAMNKVPGIDSVYFGLKESLVSKCCEIIRGGNLEAAYEWYKSITSELCAKYAVEI